MQNDFPQMLKDFETEQFTEDINKQPEIKICCIAGGGVKGIFPIKLINLYALPNDYGVYVGTSVGAIICAALAFGFNTKKIEKDFPIITAKIFGKKRIIGAPKYSLKNATEILNNYFLGAKCSTLKSRLIIASVDLVGDLTYYLKAEDYPDLTIAEFIARSMCAPFYFENIPDGKETMRIWSDGGVGYHNFPVTPAIMETLRHPNAKYTIHAFGTGFVRKTKEETEKQYNRLVKKNWWGDLCEFLSLKTGGFARKSSKSEQVNTGKYWAKHTNSKFVYYDAILEKEIALDDYKTIQKDIKFNTIREE